MFEKMYQGLDWVVDHVFRGDEELAAIAVSVVSVAVPLGLGYMIGRMLGLL
jgi:hypothetical protein